MYIFPNRNIFMAADKTFTSLLGAIELISKINLFYSKTEQQFKTKKGFSRLLFTKWCFNLCQVA